MPIMDGDDRMKQREGHFMRRNERVRAVCEKYKDVGKGFERDDGEFFTYDLTNRLAWCRTAKVRERGASFCDNFTWNQTAVWDFNVV